jgi:hypothetical protein
VGGEPPQRLFDDTFDVLELAAGEPLLQVDFAALACVELSVALEDEANVGASEPVEPDHGRVVERARIASCWLRSVVRKSFDSVSQVSMELSAVDAVFAKRSSTRVTHVSAKGIASSLLRYRPLASPEGRPTRQEVCPTTRSSAKLFWIHRHGLSLAISRSLVEAHGGRLWCAQNENGGETFSFTLPT